jgi:DNA-directed RNA polymerase II subunit RPB2
MEDSTTWKIIGKYFQENPQALVNHHIDSFDDFYKRGIFQIFKEKNPVTLYSRLDATTNEYMSECHLYMGGKDGSKIYFGKPVIHDDNNVRYMFPNEARLRNMSYSMSIHYDIEVEIINKLRPGELPTLLGGSSNITDEVVGGDSTEDTPLMVGGGPKPVKKRRNAKEHQDIDMELDPQQAAELRKELEESLDGNIQRRTHVIKRVFLGRFPVMVQSDFCVLHGMPREARYSTGECKNDLGGYFIINGKEKTVVSQEKFADNMLYVRKATDDKYLYSADIRSVSENVSKPVRTLSVKMKAPTNKFTNQNIVVNIPNVRAPVPLFIVFRALGVISDKDIIAHCLLDMEKYESMIDIFIPSVHDASTIMTQQNALQYIALLTKGKGTRHAIDYFLPHVGETNYVQKAYFLGHIVFKLLSISTGLDPPTDRDNFKFKRIELVGSLLYDLFREYWSIQLRTVQLAFEKKLYYNQEMYESNLLGLITENFQEVFQERELEEGVRMAFKGNWGAHTHTKRIGAVQDLNRLSFNSAINHLRKTNLPLDSSLKVVGPRVLHNSQWGFIDPIDTPDGGSIGLHKHLAITTYITRGVSREPMLNWLREKWGMKSVQEYSPMELAKLSKVFVNGYWAGMVDDPMECVRIYNLYRRNALVPIYASASFDIRQNTIFVCTDAGRLCRPIFYRDETTKKASYQAKAIMKKLEDGDFTWKDLTCGFNKMREGVSFQPSDMKIYELHELYEGVESETNPAKLERFLQNKGIIEYIDNNASENALIAINTDAFESGRLEVQERLDTDPIKHLKQYTHCEIHNSLIFGMMGNLIIFPENNPATRNSFSCGQSKQACSLYHTNYQMRMDKTAVVLNSGQTPLVKSRYLDVITKEENSYGENVIVAIACYTGYNVEDAILVNEASLKRGLFRTSYFNSYEAHEETTKNASSMTDIRFMNIEKEPLVRGLKDGYDYSQLDEYGIIRQGSFVNDKTVLIGLVTVTSPPVGSLADEPPSYKDASKTPKKGQLGIVDKVFITDDEQGRRIAKVRILEQRIPTLGDKMGSRAGQKGTVGNVVPECDMPFTAEGLRPDIIINPHAIPSRMTVGQLVESITGKACAMFGGFGDCTAFNNKGSKIGVFGEMLTKMGYHSNGNEIMYDGMNGMQMESEIFIGPTYYMRLKHMVKDKVNYRARGPRTALTKQPVSGRANDGGLRIGEMERDTVISHGISNFLQDSMMERGDQYYMAICNHSGVISVYNPAKNIFMSPIVDGPLKFVGSLDDVENLRLERITKYGRSFSIVSVPYSFKLMIQELQTINVQLRIITEDNIDQIEHMSSNHNIEKLTSDGATMKTLIEMIHENIYNSRSDRIFTPDEGEYTPTPSPITSADDSASYHPDADGSPYGPGTPPDSPAYNPDSPAYAPDSPAYVPGSPAYVPGTPHSSLGYTDDESITPPSLLAPGSPNYPPPGSPNYPPPGSPNYPPPGSPNYPPPNQGSVNNSLSSDGSIPPPPTRSFNSESSDGSVPPPPTHNIGDEESADSSEEVTKQVGGRICLRDDVEHPTRPWKISHIGEKFITIHALDRDNLNEDDYIRVVSPQDIHSEYRAKQFANKIMNAQYHSHLSDQHSGSQAAPTVIIAPKFFNGSSNDQSNGNMGIAEEYMGATVEPTIMSKPVSKEKAEKDVANGEIDFSNIKIVKQN